MVEGDSTKTQKQRVINNTSGKSFNDQNQTKIVLRRLPPTLTPEQFLEIVSPLPDHDYFRFCKADLSLGQPYAYSRAYIDISNRQDLIVFTEKFQGYVFLDKNGNEYICSIEYAPSQRKPKFEQQQRKDQKVNTIEQDPEYETFVANLNGPLDAADALPNAETMLEEIEKKQRDIHDNKHKGGVATTPLLEFIKRKREERKQEKNMRLLQQQQQQRRNNKASAARNAMANNDDSRPSTNRTTTADDDFPPSSRYGGGDRSNRHHQQQRGSEKSDYRSTPNDSKQKRSNTGGDHSGNKSSKNRQQQQGSKSKQQQKQNNESSTSTINEESSSIQTERPDSASTETTTTINDNDEHSKSSSSTQKIGINTQTKNRPSIQIYNPGERARIRRQQNPPS